MEREREREREREGGGGVPLGDCTPESAMRYQVVKPHQLQAVMATVLCSEGPA